MQDVNQTVLTLETPVVLWLQHSSDTKVFCLCIKSGKQGLHFYFPLPSIVYWLIDCSKICHSLEHLHSFTEFPSLKIHKSPNKRTTANTCLIKSRKIQKNSVASITQNISQAGPFRGQYQPSKRLSLKQSEQKMLVNWISYSTVTLSVLQYKMNTSGPRREVRSAKKRRMLTQVASVSQLWPVYWGSLRTEHKY